MLFSAQYLLYSLEGLCKISTFIHMFIENYKYIDMYDLHHTFYFSHEMNDFGSLLSYIIKILMSPPLFFFLYFVQIYCLLLPWLLDFSCMRHLALREGGLTTFRKDRSSFSHFVYFGSSGQPPNTNFFFLTLHSSKEVGDI